MNQQLLDYIKQCFAQGIAEAQVSETLIKAGWKKEDVSEALKSFSLKTAPVIAPVKPDQFKPIGQSKPLEQKDLIKPASQANQTAPAAKPNSVNPLKQLNEAKSKKSFQDFFNRKNKYFIIIISVVIISLLSAGAYAFIKGYLFPSKQTASINLEKKVVVVASSTTGNQVDNNGNANTASSSLATSSLATSSLIDINASSSSATTSTSTLATGTLPEATSTIGQASSTTANLDSDNDGLTDAEEKIYGTDPHNPDTDGDGYLDGAEVKAGYNPLGAGKLIK